jgi:hypothetical protein
MTDSPLLYSPRPRPHAQYSPYVDKQGNKSIPHYVSHPPLRAQQADKSVEQFLLIPYLVHRQRWVAEDLRIALYTLVTSLSE